MTLPAFPCNKCGLCCRNVHLAEETRFLDRGDGTCRHHDTASRQCTIYANRPEICQVDRQYQRHYANTYTWSEFVEVNLQVCKALDEQASRQQIHANR
ncbi:YkgJ family cysteine cluster protein [Pseudomonas mosselii]